MLKKTLIVLAILVLIGGGIAWYLYQSLQADPLPISEADRAQLQLMPLPAQMIMEEGKMYLSDNIGISVRPSNVRLEEAGKRLVKRWNAQPTPSKNSPFSGNILISWQGIGSQYPLPQVDESYILTVDSDEIRIKSETELGALHALETLLQLARQDEHGTSLPLCEIQDQARYSWRGLMIDVCRHWIPKEVILRTLDGMAAVKLNVLHLSLTNDQGFRIESKRFPRLHEMGANGQYFTQADMKEIIDYAADRGIRIVPEFNIPGHSTSWFIGHPELASSEGPFQLPATFGVKPSAIDPTKKSTYQFLDELFAEMADLFPDPYFHIGGDEVLAEAWDTNPAILQFIQDHQFTDKHGLQAYFNQKVQAILSSHDKQLIGWDEIIHPDLSGPDIIVQSWRTHKSLIEAADQGYHAILSNGWYLDHKLDAETYYLHDPEVVKGGVDIEPDSIWESYAIDMEIQGNTIPSTLTLFGTDDDLRGVWGLMENLTGVDPAKKEGDQLSFQVEGPMGTVNFEGTLTGDLLTGSINMAFLSFELAGKKIGGHDMAGTVAPKIERIPTLTDSSRARILGGEACMWSEVVSGETVDSRIWPSTAAIAEKLWSPQVLTTDAEDMYRRLDELSRQLDKLGLTHMSYRKPLLQRIAPNSPDLAALETFVAVLQEGKYYKRLGNMFGKPLDTPLEFLADAAAPESQTARLFKQQVGIFLADTSHQTHKKELLRSMRIWESNHRPMLSTIQQNPRLAPYQEMSKYLSVISNIGITAVHAIANGTTLPLEEEGYYEEMLALAERSVEGAELAVIEGMRALVLAAKGGRE
ncbi:MAG: family 20 glycosylhydrolase [Bacteroidota bacterium]